MNQKRLLVIVLSISIVLLGVISYFLIGQLGDTHDVAFDIKQALKDYTSIDRAFSDAEDTYLSDAGFIREEDAPALMQEICDIAELMHQNGTISDYEYHKEFFSLYVEFSNSGIGYLYSPPIENQMNRGQGNSQIITFEPFADEFYANYLLASAKGPEEAANEILSVCPDLFSYPEKNNLDVTDVSVEALQELVGKKIIIWCGHGGYVDEYGPVLFLGTKKWDKATMRLYNEELSKHQLVLGSAGDYYITPLYLDKFSDDAFSGSLIYLGACNSMTDERLAQAFWDHGAYAILGNTRPVNVSYNFQMIYSFFHAFATCRDDGRFNSISEALSMAKEENGQTDPWPLSYKSEVVAAYRSDCTLWQIGTGDLLENDAVQYVTDAYSKDCTYTTKIYNEQTGGSEETQITASYRIPEIHLTGDTVEKINTELYDALYPVIQNSVSEIAEYGYPWSSEEISYDWVVNGDILSLVVENRKLPDYGAGTEYYVYNISISDGTVLSTESVVAAAGFSMEEYYKQAELVLGSHYWSGWELSNGNFENSDFVSWFNDALQKTISQDNVNQSFPYMNEQGQLCIVAKIYSLAGAEYYWNNLNMINFELNPNYNKSAQLKVSETADGNATVPAPAAKINQEEALQIARKYWNCASDESSGFWIQDQGTQEKNGKNYYRFALRQKVEDHWSTMDWVYIDAETGEPAFW